MARKQGIPQEVREQVVAIVEAFNERHRDEVAAGPLQSFRQLLGLEPAAADDSRYRPGDYVPRFKGSFLYLDRAGYDGRLSEICRLKWTGDMNRWEFAIYRHTRNRYDPDEWMFPGAGEVDGTVEGAMRAGMQAYPF